MRPPHLNKGMVHISTYSTSAKFDDDAREFWGIPNNQERVSSSTIWGIPALVQGCRLISTTVARTEVFPYKSLPGGGRKIDEAHAIYPLITGKCNLFQTAYSFKSNLISQCLWSGDGYGYIERDDLGTPTALFNLDSRSTYTVQEFTNGRLSNVYYVVSTEAEPVVLNNEDIIHIRNFTPLGVGFEGLSIVDSLKSVLGKTIAMNKLASLVFKNGSHITKILKIPGWLSDTQQQELKSSMKCLYEGVANAGKMAVLMGGAEISTLPIDLEKFESVQHLEFSINEISAVLGISPAKLGGKGFTSYGSLEADDLNQLGDCYDHHFTNLETELSAKLLTPKEQKNRFIEFDRESMFLTNPDYRQKIITQYEHEALSWEEMREKLNLSTDREGQFVRPSSSVLAMTKEEQEAKEKEAADLEAQRLAAQQAAAEQAAKAEPEPSEEEAEPEDKIERAIQLTEATLNRIKTRLIKSSAPIIEHAEIIRSSLAGLNAEVVIDELLDMNEELNEVLPEQREEVLSKWNTRTTAESLWK